MHIWLFFYLMIKNVWPGEAGNFHDIKLLFDRLCFAKFIFKSMWCIPAMAYPPYCPDHKHPRQTPAVAEPKWFNDVNVAYLN